MLVQLVRMPACHAGGNEFNSRAYRGKKKYCFFYLDIKNIICIFAM